MKKLLSLILFLFPFAHALPAANVFVSQNGGVFSGGSACNGQTAISIATSNSRTYNPGDVVTLCGTISSGVAWSSSGTSSSVVTLKFDTSARISLPFCNSVCLSLNGVQWVVVDGGTPCGPATPCSGNEAANPTGYPANITGIIEATAAGSPPLPNQVVITRGIVCTNCTNVEVKNIILRNFYQHTAFSDVTNSSDNSTAFGTNNSSHISFHDFVMHDTECGFCKLSGPNGSFINIFHGVSSRYNWGIGEGGDANQTATDWYLHDSIWGSTANWDDQNDRNHHNHFIFQNDPASANFSFTRFFIYNNLFNGQVGANNTGIIFWDHGPVTNSWVYNNVFNNFGNVNPVSNGIQQGSAGATSSINVLNNTFIDATGANAAVQGCLMVQGTGQLIENNLFTNCQQFVYYQFGTGTTTCPSPNTIDWNFYGVSSNTSHVFATDCSGFKTTMAAWRAFTGQESHSIYNQSGIGVNNDGTLQGGSQAINAANNLSSLCSVDPQLQALCFDTTAGGTRTPSARPSTGPWTGGASNASGSLPGPFINLSQSALSFTSINGVATASQSVTVTNSGSSTLHITTAALTGGSPSNFNKTADTCTGAALATNASCSFSVQLTPPLAFGNWTSSVVLTSSDVGVGGNNTISLTGFSTYLVQSIANCTPVGSTVTCNWPAAQVLGDFIACGVGQSSTIALTGTADTSANTYANLSGAGLTTASEGATNISQQIVTSTNIAAAGAGANTTTFTFASAPTFPDVRCVQLRGVATVSAIDRLNGSGSPNGVSNLANTPGSTTTSSGTFTSLNANDIFVGFNMVQQLSISPGTCCLLAVASNGGELAEYQVANSAGSYTVTAPQQGTGAWVFQVLGVKIGATAGATISITAGPLTFAKTPLGGQSAPQTVTLTNTSLTVPVNISTKLFTGGTHPESFSVTNDMCGQQLAINSSCTVQVIFNPAVVSSSNNDQTSTLVFTTDAAGGTNTIAVQGTGTSSEATATKLLASITIPAVGPATCTVDTLPVACACNQIACSFLLH